MATTWMKAIHRGNSIVSTLKIRTDYAMNQDKTEAGELIDSFECAPQTVDSEFLLSKRLYEQKTGRNQGKHDVIAYHLRMSFKPGEVSAEQALELGHELAIRWTRGKHQFIVAAHTNTNNPHAHIIFNSVNLECDGKYQDFKRSAIALRRISDQICLEHGLSVIEKPGLSKGFNRNEYLGNDKPPSVRDQLRDLMDKAINGCKDFDDFLANLESLGVEIKHGKQLAFKLPGGKRFSRQDTLGEDYSVEAIPDRISGKRVVVPRKKPTAPTEQKRFNLLIDIQEKIQQGYGEGFEHWASVENVKQAAKTLMFIQNNGVDNYEILEKKCSVASDDFNNRQKRIKEIETRLKEISELQKYIGQYGKTRETFRRYKAMGMKEDFYENNRADITLHEAARRYFDRKGYGKNNKLPSINSLKQEYATLLSEKKKLYVGYKETREEMIDWQRAKHNVDVLLDVHKKPSRTHANETR